MTHWFCQKWLVSTLLVALSISKVVALENVSASERVNQYNGQSRTLELTTEEALWLEQNPVVSHGLVTGNRHKPFEYTDEKGQHRGITSDYLAILSDLLGVKFKTEFHGKNHTELALKLLNNEVSLATYIPRSPYIEKRLTFSNAIISMPVVMLGRQDAPILAGLASIDKERVAVQQGSYAHSFLVNHHPNVRFYFVNKTVDGLMAVNDNKADIFIHNIFSAEYYSRKLDITPLKILGTTQYDYQIYFAVHNDAAPLIGIIEKAVTQISELEKRLIFDKWINVEVEHKFDWGRAMQIGLTVFAVILVVISGFVVWNRKLASSVTKRTQELRALARHIENVREEEKAKLSREIHDELGHTLTALSMGLRRLKTIDDKHDRLAKNKELSALVNQASSTSKRIMTDLRVSILEDLGLEAAIEWLVQEFGNRYPIQVALNVSEHDVVLDEEATITLFRFVQESLTNIAKHAQANKVTVGLSSQDSKYIIYVSDDGRGMDGDWQNKQGSFGLIGMRERAIALGGKMKVTSNKGKGVLVQLSIPKGQC